jgi:hypothetical protein
MIMSKCGALIATINGLLPEVGHAIVAAFKNLKSGIEKQSMDLQTSLKDHHAGTKERALEELAKREAEADIKARGHIAQDMADLIEEQPPARRTLEDIGEELKAIAAEPRRPTVEPGVPHEGIRQEIGETTGRMAASERGEQVLQDSLTRRVIDKISGKT